MILVLDVWNRIDAYSAKYQSGTDVVAYFNSALAEVQLELFNTVSPLYDANEKVKSLLDFWVKSQAGNSASDGSLAVGTDPEVVNRPLGVGYTDGTNILFGIYEVSENELVAIARMPQRAPNVAKKIVYYRFNSPNTIQFYPATTTPYSLFYLIYPTEAKIAFTFTETDDEDIMTYDPTDSVDLGWPQSAYNLIVYLMLQKYGVTVRESILEEYSKFGVTEAAQGLEVKEA